LGELAFFSVERRLEVTADAGNPNDPVSAQIHAAAAGDETAMRALLAAVWPDAYRIARSVLRDRQLAEDAAQEACVRVLTGLGDLRHPAAFRVWFFRLVTREAYRRLPSVRRESPADLTAGDPEWATLNAASSAELLDLRRAVRALPHTYQLPVLLRYYLGLSDREVAQVLGTTAGAIRVRLVIARRTLRRSLDDTGGHPRAASSIDAVSRQTIAHR
jgi:RNA polymerase sigma factor (sigma-70 family)